MMKMDWLYKMEWFILIDLFLGLFMMIEIGRVLFLLRYKISWFPCGLILVKV